MSFGFDVQRTMPLLTTVFALMFAPSFILAEDSGRVHGQLLDIAGQSLAIPNAFAFLCDAEVGYPLQAKSRQIISRTNGFGGIDQWFSARTDNDGKFTFENVPLGKYRIVAQSWIGRDSLPSVKDHDVSVMLHGCAKNVEVKQNQTTNCTIKALGSSTLRIQTEPDEGHAYLFLSLKPTLGEPILGPMLWGENFTTNIMSAVHIRRGAQTYFGLPNNAEVHVMLLNYDNNAGIGGVTVRTNQFTNATLPIYATWSNGYHEPPERLKPLVEWIRSHPQQATNLLNSGLDPTPSPKQGRLNYLSLFKQLQQNPHQIVDVLDVGKFKKLDLLAAQSYLRILQSHEQRKR